MVTMAAIAHDFVLPIKTEQDLKDFISIAFGISIPDKQICPNHSTPWRAFCDAYFAISPVAVWEASRGFGGKSFLLALLGQVEAATLKCDVNILGGSGEQSTRVHDYMQRLWDYEDAPRYLLASDPSKIETKMIWGNKIKALMASQASVRGPHPVRLRLDECLAEGTNILTPHGECHIQCLSIGDVVYSVYENTIRENKITGITNKGNRDTIVIRTNTGKLIATPEHPIYTKAGWKRAEEVTKDDTLYGLRKTHPLRQRGFTKSLHELLSKIHINRKIKYLRMRKSENTLRSSLFSLLSQITRKEIESLFGLWKNIVSEHNQTMQKMSFEMDEWNGIESDGSITRDCLRKDNKQTRTSGKGFIGLFWDILDRAGSDRELRCRFIGERKYSYRGIWRILARERWFTGKRRKENKEIGIYGISSNNIASIRDTFLVEEVRINSIKPGGIKVVYDISVEQDHNFIANGIVSHNCDEMDLRILDSAMGQPMSSKSVQKQTVMSSTHQYADGTMTEILTRANEKSWPVYTWCYRECLEPHGWLPESEVESKKLEVTKVMWDNEYELQEPSPESRAIQTDKVAAMFDKSLGEFRGGNREYIEIEPPKSICVKCHYEKEREADDDELNCPNGCKNDRNGKPIALHLAKYATGADWAKKQDWTIIPTLRYDVKPIKVVAFERMGREPWPAMVDKFERRLQRFGNKACHDATGIGDVVDGYLTVRANGIIMVGRERSNLLSNYIGAVERGEIISPLIHFMETEHRLASVDDVYGSGHLPDTISGMALAYKALSEPEGIGFR